MQSLSAGPNGTGPGANLLTPLTWDKHTAPCLKMPLLNQETPSHERTAPRSEESSEATATLSLRRARLPRPTTQAIPALQLGSRAFRYCR